MQNCKISITADLRDKYNTEKILEHSEIVNHLQAKSKDYLHRLEKYISQTKFQF